MSKSIYVFADWIGMYEPELVGLLMVDITRGKEVFRFQYEDEWLHSHQAHPIDPELSLIRGPQFNPNPDNNKNFRVFMGSSPDRWGDLLMKRRESVHARIEGRKPKRLLSVDFLLGVHDTHRMGGLRFKASVDGEFLDNNTRLATPHISSIRELEHAALNLDKDSDINNEDYIKWLNMLISPGSSLGGARPKACVIDKDELWIAKFPGRYDDRDMGAWEYLTYILAKKSGIEMSECKLIKLNSNHHTFLTKRFDRILTSENNLKRVHFSSAMTQLGYYDGEDDASYLELADFISTQGTHPENDLKQLWRRIVFNIAVSNTDDHLRNHGFILDTGGWRLSPAYDLNPEPDKNSLHLNINETDNSLDLGLALEIAIFFRLSKEEALDVIDEIIDQVSSWQDEANKIGLSSSEIEKMKYTFIDIDMKKEQV